MCEQTAKSKRVNIPHINSPSVFIAAIVARKYTKLGKCRNSFLTRQLFSSICSKTLTQLFWQSCEVAFLLRENAIVLSRVKVDAYISGCSQQEARWCEWICFYEGIVFNVQFSSLLGGRKSGKTGEDLGLSNLRRSPWALPSDPSLARRSPVGERPDRIVSSNYLPSSRSPLLDSHPFRRNSLKKQSTSLEEKVRPFDLSDLGLSDSGATHNRGYPTGHSSLWKTKDRCFNNPDSLFSSSSLAADNQFQGKSTWHSNNWVNFLDASNVNDGAVTRTKTMAEIWDAGQSPLGSDGWSVYPPPAASPVPPASSEADAVDALFSQMPSDWSSAAAGPKSPFSTQEVSWTPPPDVSSIWSSGYLVSSSTAEPLPTSSAASYVPYAVQPQQNQESLVQPSFEPLSSLGSSIWNPTGVTSTWSSTSE